MIDATGTLDAMQLSIGGAPIAVLNHAKLGYVLNGQAYTVRRQGFFAMVYTLMRDDQPVVAIQSAAFVNRFTFAIGDRTWMLKAETTSVSWFGLYENDTKVGAIGPASGTRGNLIVAIDLPDAIPLEVQVFAIWLVLWKWGDS